MTQVLSEFYGMTILMDEDSRDKKPHIKVLYEQELSKFDIKTGRMYEGSLDKLGQENVQDWISLNSRKLQENWNRIQAGEKVTPIEPLI